MNIDQPGAYSFTQLLDVPKTYFGAGGRILTVNPFETGIDFNPPGGSASWGGISGVLSNQTDLQTALDAKQATLVSSTNIKTINGASVLGAGNLIVGGSLTKGITEVDFGPTEQGEAVVSVVDAAITATSYPVVTMYALATADHDPDDYMAEGVTAYVTNVVAGVGFDIAAGCNDTTWGKYAVTFAY